MFLPRRVAAAASVKVMDHVHVDIAAITVSGTSELGIFGSYTFIVVAKCTILRTCRGWYRRSEHTVTPYDAQFAPRALKAFVVSLKLQKFKSVLLAQRAACSGIM